MEPLTIFTLAELLGLVTGAIGYRVAERRGRPGAEGFWLGFFFSVLGIFIELMLRRGEQPRIILPQFEQPQMTNRKLRLVVSRRDRPFRECPFCAEMILAEASVCRFCKGNLLAAGKHGNFENSRTGDTYRRSMPPAHSDGRRRPGSFGTGAAGTRKNPRRGSANPRLY